MGILISLYPLEVFAHGNAYFEFNPDYFKTNSLDISSGPVYQIFLPVNEFMGGFDLWFDNAGSSGTATFQLYDQSDLLVKSAQITIPHIDPITGGKRTHVDWSSQFPVAGSNKYKLKIESALPQLRIYYADRVGFIEHNAPYASQYMNGVAQVAGEEKEFSFKFALYEVSEGSPPILSNVAVSVLSYEQVKLEFNSNEPVDHKIEYKLNDSQNSPQVIPFSGSLSFCNQGVNKCSALLSVIPNASYQYTLTVKDVWGNQAQVSGLFSSKTLESFTPNPSATPTPTNTQAVNTPMPDNTPPIISGLKVADLSNGGVNISWETNEAANSSMIISFTNDKISIAAASDPTFELLHLLKIEGQLNPATPYLATVTSYDSANNVSSASIKFTTLAGQSTPSPTPSGEPLINPTPSPVAVSDNKDSKSITISWVYPTKEPESGYRVDIFDDNRSLIKSINVDPGVHSVTVADLPGGNKSVIVYSNNKGVYEKIGLPVQAKDTSFIKRILGMWPYLLVAIGGILGLLLRNYFLKKEPPQATLP